MKKFKAILFAAFISVGAIISLGVEGSAGEAKKYVPFLGREVKVSVLHKKVKATDASFKDFGAQAATQFWNLHGNGVEICVVDTGVDPTHEQLDNGKVVAFADFVNGQTVAYDDHGHGTHVASIAAGEGTGGSDARRLRGVAVGASVSAAKVLSAYGSGSYEQVIQGIEWCAERGADIMSMSLGGAPSDGTDVLSQAVAKAASMGVIPVVAGGNAGPGFNTILAPGSSASAITVGAAAEWSGGSRPERSFGPFLARFSSRGGNTLAPKPDIVAPGVTVMAATAETNSGYHAWSGTSMATPYVSGTIALMLEADPTLGLERVRGILQGTAFDAGLTGYDRDWGFGMINSYSAVARVLGEAEKNIFPPHYFFTGSVPTSRGWHTYKLNFGLAHNPILSKKQPIAVTVNMLNPESELGFLLMNDEPKFLMEFNDTISVGLPRRGYGFGALPYMTTAENPFGVVLYGFPSLYGDPEAVDSGSFYIDLFYR